MMELVVRHGQKAWVVQWFALSGKRGGMVFFEREAANEHVVGLRAFDGVIVTMPLETECVLNDASSVLESAR